MARHSIAKLAAFMVLAASVGKAAFGQTRVTAVERAADGSNWVLDFSSAPWASKVSKVIVSKCRFNGEGCTDETVIENPGQRFVTLSGQGYFEVRFRTPELFGAYSSDEWVQLVPAIAAADAEIRALASRHAPLLSFHPDEKRFPVLAKELFSDFSVGDLKWSSRGDGDIDDKESVASALSFHGSSENSFFIDKKLLRAYNAGSRTDFPAYWYHEYSSDKSKLFITFALIYSYDYKGLDPDKPGLVDADHGLDRESVAIEFDRVEGQWLPRHVYYAGHLESQPTYLLGCRSLPSCAQPGERAFVGWSGGRVKVSWAASAKRGNRPIAYVARGSHAMFPAAGWYYIDNGILPPEFNLTEPAGDVDPSTLVGPSRLIELALDSDESRMFAFSGFVIDGLSAFANSRITPHIRFPAGDWSASAKDPVSDCVECKDYMYRLDAPAIPNGAGPDSARGSVGSTVAFAVQAVGTGPLEYQWRRNGAPIACTSRDNCWRLDWAVGSDDDGATFDVVVSNAAGSVTSNEATLTLEPPAPPPVAGVPDLLPLGIASDAVGVEPGQTVSISVTVENRGLGSAQASSMLLQLSTDRDSPGTAAPWAEVSIPPLSSGASISLTANGAAPSVPGSYYVWATVDSRGTAGQNSDARSNDSDRMTDPLVVQPAPPAGAVDLSPTITSIVQSRVAMGGLITIGFTVANSGRSDSLATTATVRLSPSSAPESTGPVLATVPIRSIAAGRSGLFSATFNAPFEPGIYRVQVEVDPSNVAGQGAGDRANDVVLSTGEVNVLTTGYPGGTPWEGAYEGSIAGGTYPAFRMYVLDSGEYWAFYGYIASTGSLNGGFFAQGNVSFGGSAFSSSDSLDFGFFPARAASVSGELNPTTRELSASANVAGANTTWAGLPLNRVIYDYAAPASLDSIAGAWGIQFNTGDRAVINVEAAGAFQAVSTGGCSMSGRLTPAPNGRNFFRLTVTFGGAPCLLAGQTTSGIAVRHSLSNGTPGIEFAVMTADRRGGAAGWGSR